MKISQSTDWKSPYTRLVTLYLAFITFAGLIVVVFHRSFWVQDVSVASGDFDYLLVLSLPFYIGLDLVRTTFTQRTVSFGFPIILIAMLYTPGESGILLHPSRAILVAAIGSCISEVLYCQLKRPRLALEKTLAGVRDR